MLFCVKAAAPPPILSSQGGILTPISRNQSLIQWPYAPWLLLNYDQWTMENQTLPPSLHVFLPPFRKFQILLTKKLSDEFQVRSKKKSCISNKCQSNTFNFFKSDNEEDLFLFLCFLFFCVCVLCLRMSFCAFFVLVFVLFCACVCVCVFMCVRDDLCHQI